VENAYSKFVIPSRLEPKAKTSEESAFLFPLPASEKKTRPFVEIRECRLILLLEPPCDAEGKNIRRKNRGRIPKWERADRVLLYNCTYDTIQVMEIVIDTSAILAVIGEQPEKASLVRLTRGATLVAPPSVHWEVGNALSAMFKRKAIGIGEALQLLEAYAAIPIRMAGIDLKQAVELSARLNVYAYDAYVLACALSQGTPLLTLDGGLKERARELKLDVLEGEAR
jgi:predicted nucleic acid-binding protein